MLLVTRIVALLAVDVARAVNGSLYCVQDRWSDVEDVDENGRGSGVVDGSGKCVVEVEGSVANGVNV